MRVFCLQYSVCVCVCNRVIPLLIALCDVGTADPRSVGYSVYSITLRLCVYPMCLCVCFVSDRAVQPAPDDRGCEPVPGARIRLRVPWLTPASWCPPLLLQPSAPPLHPSILPLLPMQPLPNSGHLIKGLEGRCPPIPRPREGAWSGAYGVYSSLMHSTVYSSHIHAHMYSMYINISLTHACTLYTRSFRSLILSHSRQCTQTWARA